MLGVIKQKRLHNGFLVPPRPLSQLAFLEIVATLCSKIFPQWGANGEFRTAKKSPFRKKHILNKRDYSIEQ
jgi:hypothetical protein